MQGVLFVPLLLLPRFAPTFTSAKDLHHGHCLPWTLLRDPNHSQTSHKKSMSTLLSVNLRVTIARLMSGLIQHNLSGRTL